MCGVGLEGGEVYMGQRGELKNVQVHGGGRCLVWLAEPFRREAKRGDESVQ